jgi:hypothetical protein
LNNEGRAILVAADRMVFTMTRGGPGSATELISLMIQRVGFRVFDQGVASVQAIVLLVIAIVLSRRRSRCPTWRATICSTEK